MVASFGGFGGLLLFIIDIWAFISIIGSRASAPAKVFWVLVVVFLPLLGFIAWLVAGPKASKAVV